MSDSTNTITGHALPAAGTLRYLDPHALRIGENVRDTVDLGKAFLASLTEHGVLVPITAVASDDGTDTVTVLNGQRRTLGARQVGLVTVPVYVLATRPADASAETVERIVHQIVTNDQKDDLTDAQRARGIQTMIDSGLSITKVAKKLSVPKETVKAAGAAAKSTTAMDALDSGQLSLTEAAAITEFDDDPGDVERLVAAAGTARFDHTVAQIRAERASAQALTAAAATYTARGFTVLPQACEWGWNLDCVPLRHLHTREGEPVDPDTVTDPQCWAVWLEEHIEYVDAATGELVDEADIDWNTEDPSLTPDDGLRHVDTIAERPAFAPKWYCLDPDRAGVHLSDAFRRNAEWAARRQNPSPEHAGHDPDTATSDADRQAQRERAEAARAEAQRRERRKVLTLNKLGAAAITVRREFIKTLVARKTLPKGAAVFIADCLARDSYMLTNLHAEDTTAELLGVDNAGAGVRKLIAELSPGSADGRAQVITLALVLGALEALTTKESWRSAVPAAAASANPNWSHQVTSADYLQFLTANGYTLCGVEEIITGARSADDVYDACLAQAETQ
jgi:ParB family chromosome partitioning protein